MLKIDVGEGLTEIDLIVTNLHVLFVFIDYGDKILL